MENIKIILKNQKKKRKKKKKYLGCTEAERCIFIDEKMRFS